MNGYIGLTQNPQPFTNPPAAPTWNGGNWQNGGPPAQSNAWQVGEKQPAQPLPTTPPYVPQVGVPYRENQQAFPGQGFAEFSVDRMALSDPYLQSMLQHYSQKGQTIQQVSEESS